MPIDKRLYMTFPNDFWQHPKIELLSDNAFRAFVEMNGYSRMQDLDGRIPVEVVKRRWKPRSVTELVNSHPERPVLLREGDEYVIRDYAQHQMTKASRDSLSEKRAKAGAKGGKARANAKQLLEPEGKQNEAESESELETDDDITRDPQTSHLGEVVASGTQYSDDLVERAEKRGILNLPATHQLLQKAVGEVFLSPAGAIRLATAVADKAKEPVQKVDAYVASACRNSPDEVWGLYDQLDLGGVP